MRYVLYVQGTEDVAHPRPHLDRFVAAYRKAGGVVDLELFEGEAGVHHAQGRLPGLQSRPRPDHRVRAQADPLER